MCLFSLIMSEAKMVDSNSSDYGKTIVWLDICSYATENKALLGQSFRIDMTEWHRVINISSIKVNTFKKDR